MKKYAYLMVTAVLAILLLSCSNNDDESTSPYSRRDVTSRSYSGTSTHLLGGLISGGGTNTKPDEGPMFYKESIKSKYAISAIQISLGVRCNVVEYWENGKENTIELLGGLRGFDYFEDFDVSENIRGLDCSINYEYTDQYGVITECTASFRVSVLDNLESVKVSNLKRVSKVTQSNTVETTELTVKGSLDLAGSIYDYGNGIYYSGLWEIRGNAVESAEIDYTNYLKGRLWQKFSSVIPDDDNSISVGLIFVRQD